MKHEGQQLQIAAKLSKAGITGLTTALEIPRSTLYYNFKMEILDPEFKEKAAKALGLTVEQVFKDETVVHENGRAHNADLPAPLVDAEVKQVPFEQFMHVPYLSAVAQAGYLSAGGSDTYIKTLPKMLLPREYEKGNYLVVEVVGNSMDDGTEEAILEGDKLLCKQHFVTAGDEPLNKIKDLFIVATRDGGAVCKEITEHDVDKKMIMCHSWNPEFEDYAVFLEDVISLFRVKKLVDRKIRARKPRRN